MVVVVAVVPLTAVLVIIVPDVSVEVPDGIAEVDVVMLVSVLIVPVVMLVSEVDIVEVVALVSVAVVTLVSVVLLVFVSFLQAYPKKARATMVRRTRTFFVM